MNRDKGKRREYVPATCSTMAKSILYRAAGPIPRSSHHSVSYKVYSIELLHEHINLAAKHLLTLIFRLSKNVIMSSSAHSKERFPR